MSKQLGYNEENGFVHCLYCKQKYELGLIHRVGDAMCDARKAAELHVSSEHGSPFEALLSLDKKQTGLTDTQRVFLHHFYLGTPDAEIAKLTGTSPSTVRFQRYSFRERVKQARNILALGELLEQRSATPEFTNVHEAATQIDERYMTDDAEEMKILKQQFSSLEPPILVRFPPKEKKKLVILRFIVQQFKQGEIYTEKQVNEILKAIFHDFVTLRRYLIEYGFMDRKIDCSEYWLK